LFEGAVITYHKNKLKVINHKNIASNHRRNKLSLQIHILINNNNNNVMNVKVLKGAQNNK